MIFKKKTKIFCIGRNKTGTTSLQTALTDLGYKLGDQATAEGLMNDWAKRDFKRIIKYCKTADAFQDLPFSLDYTFQALDQAYPNSKFILTIRKDADEWYESVISFQTKIIGKNRLPTPDDLKEFPLHYKGWIWEQAQLAYGINEQTLYDRKIYTDHYNNHNARVREYFRHRPEDLLVINIAEQSAIQKICDFLGCPFNGQEMPHLNKSK